MRCNEKKLHQILTEEAVTQISETAPFEDCDTNKRKLTPAEMVSIEKTIIAPLHKAYPDLYACDIKELAKRLRIFVRYVSDNKMVRRAKAIIRPSVASIYNAIIEVPYSKKKEHNYFMPEIALYLMYKKEDGRLEDTFVRYKREKSQLYIHKRNFIARSLVWCREDVEPFIEIYDAFAPRLGIEHFIRGRSKECGLEFWDVVKRMRDVRKMLAFEKKSDRQ